MNREKKWELAIFLANDMDAVARHFEKMETKGWRLEGIDSWGYHYRRIQPGQARYTAACFPDASVYDPAPTEGQETYIDYCRAAGWELAGAFGPVQYFRAVRPDPVPIETDEAVKLTAIRRTMRKTLVPSCGAGLLITILYLMPQVTSFRADPLEYFSWDMHLSLLLLMAGLFLYSVWLLADHGIWVLRSKRSVEGGGACAKPHTRLRMAASVGLMVLTAACLALMCRDVMVRRIGSAMAVYLVFYALVILSAGWVLKWIKGRSASRGAVRAKYFTFAVGCGVLTMFVVAAAVLVFSGGGQREPAEVYVKEYPGGETIEWNIYRDPLPVTLEDLGYTVTEEDYCTYEAEVHRSFLASHEEYRQRAMASGSDLPELEYTVTTISWDWLREICWERFLEKNLDPELWPLRELDPAPWGALEAYQQDDLPHYYLLYPGRAVTLELWSGASRQEIGAVLEAILPE